MPEGLKEFLASVAAFWNSLSNSKRVALILLSSIVLVGAMVLPQVASQQRLVPLYSRLEAEDAAKIVEELDKKQIPYKLTAGGTSVLVPEDQLYELRLAMAGQGLPKGSAVGFELFDENQFGATEFEQQVSLRRAMEGELARSIATVDGVEAARVHLVLPKKSVFISKKEQASASVVVRLTNPAMFSKREVGAVVHLVSSAVAGLSRNHVSVVSTEGETLHRPSSGDGGYGSEALSDDAQSVASRLEAKALAQLERVVGKGGADVRVSVVLDPSTREETKETFEPDTTALRSEHESDENIRSESPGSQGIPGARTALPDNDGGQALGADANKNIDTTTRNSRTRNWEVDRVLEKIHTPPGSVARLSVAVLLNGTWKKQDDGAEVFVPRGADEVEQLGAMVRQAVGFDEIRGDTISVSAAKFVKASAEGLESAELPVPWWRQAYAIWGLMGAIVLCLFLTLVLVWRSSRAKRLADQAAILREAELRETQAMGSQGKASAALSSSDEAAGSLGSPQEENAEAQDALPAKADRLKKLVEGGPEAIAELRDEALLIAGKDPSTTAVVLRTWLSEDQVDENEPQAAQ